jgi:hypothetical protein
MIQYRSYNPKSPLDATAAYWAEQNESLFPIGNVELGRPELEIDLRGPRQVAPSVATAPSAADDDVVLVTLTPRED